MRLADFTLELCLKGSGNDLMKEKRFVSGNVCCEEALDPLSIGLPLQPSLESGSRLAVVMKTPASLVQLLSVSSFRVAGFLLI